MGGLCIRCGYSMQGFERIRSGFAQKNPLIRHDGMVKLTGGASLMKTTSFSQAAVQHLENLVLKKGSGHPQSQAGLFQDGRITPCPSQSFNTGKWSAGIHCRWHRTGYPRQTGCVPSPGNFRRWHFLRHRHSKPQSANRHSHRY